MNRDHDAVARDQAEAPPAAVLRRAVHRVGSPCVPLEACELEAVRGLIGEHGLQAVSRMLQMPPSTIASAAAGASLRQGNHMLLSERIRAVQKTQAASSRPGAR